MQIQIEMCKIKVTLVYLWAKFTQFEIERLDKPILERSESHAFSKKNSIKIKLQIT